MNTVSLILVTGKVQGVGFRPFIYHLATTHGYRGSVRNTPQGVEIILAVTNPQDFIDKISQQLPPTAVINNICVETINIKQMPQQFQILASSQGQARTQLAADSAICTACRADIFNEGSRYYHYPFTNCMHCGPRYAIVESLPYDRAKTALKKFPLCRECQDAYDNQGDRRYHAQASACQRCGPRLSHSLSSIAAAIKAGKIIALKGNSGFHLVLDAHNPQAIQRLRRYKNRPYKPLAMMALNVATIAQYACLATAEVEQLQSRQAPIVLLEQRSHQFPDMIASGLSEGGFMLPSTAQHYLLFHHLLGQPSSSSDWLEAANDCLLVMTSANIAGGRIISDNQQAQQQLSAVADMIVDHDRAIMMPCDDSVLRCGAKQSMMIRRARGYAPEPLCLAESLPNVLALGTLLKNSVCFIRDNQAYPSQYLGDMDQQSNIDYFHAVIRHYQQLFDLKFEAVATDLHPDFYPSCYAETLALPIYTIQHHEAHLAAVIAERQLQGKALALALDGYGYGYQGQTWGSELFICDCEQAQFQHCGQFLPMLYLSGNHAAKQPWRMALALCHQFDLTVPQSILSQQPLAIPFCQTLQQSNKQNTTTSCGRLFDAVSSLLNVCHHNSYEAEAAMRLQSLVERPIIDPDLFAITDNNQLDLRPLLHNLAEQSSPQRASELFHGSLSYAIGQWLLQTATQHGLEQIILSGGCFQNTILLAGVRDLLYRQGMSVYTPEMMPFNDGALSLGQAWLAAKKRQQQQSRG